MREEKKAAHAAGNWIDAADVDRLVRELDVALNGEEGAAPQASLCDVVGQAKAEAAKLGRPLLAAPAAVARPSEDVRKKIVTNTWDHFGDILPTLKAISRGEWYWGANSRCKYIEIRLDTRDGGCILYDRDRVRISPEQFAFQAGGGVGKMEPWPAKNALAAAPTTQAAPVAQGGALTQAARDVLAELERATRKFPTWPTDPLHALAVLGEEFGELTKDMLQLTYEPHKTNAANVRTEALQTAAMALRLFMSLDRYEYRPGVQHSQQEGGAA